MKPRLKISPTLLAVSGCVIALRAVYLLYTLELTSAETLLARALGAVMLGSLLVTLGFVQNLARQRKEAPHPDTCEKFPHSGPRNGGA